MWGTDGSCGEGLTVDVGKRLLMLVDQPMMLGGGLNVDVGGLTDDVGKD